MLAVKRFYERGGADQLTLGEDWDYGLKVTFEVTLEDGALQRPIDLPAVQGFWLASNTSDADADDQCLVCGESKPVLDRLQAKIKGIRGGQPSGTSIISANSSAFESYGLKASRIAPTCRECGESFTRALNSLLADERGAALAVEAAHLATVTDAPAAATPVWAAALAAVDACAYRLVVTAVRHEYAIVCPRHEERSWRSPRTVPVRIAWEDSARPTVGGQEREKGGACVSE